MSSERFQAARQNDLAVALMVMIPPVFGGELENIPVMIRTAIAAAAFWGVATGISRYVSALSLDPDDPARGRKVMTAVIAVNLSAAVTFVLSVFVFIVLLAYGLVRILWEHQRLTPKSWMDFLEKRARPVGLKYLDWLTVLSILGGSLARYAAGVAASGVRPFHWIAILALLAVIAYRYVWTTDEVVDSITKAAARGETPGY